VPEGTFGIGIGGTGGGDEENGGDGKAEALGRDCAKPSPVVMTASSAASAAPWLPRLGPVPLDMESFLDRNRGEFKPSLCPAGQPVLASRPMKDALDLLKTRRSIKPMELAAPGPSPTELETLLTIASRVPDHGKLTPWRFIVFEGEARRAAGDVIAEVFRSNKPEATADQIEFERNRLARAPLVVAVVSRAAPHVKIPEWEQIMSAGAAATSLVFAAHALGYAASWLTEWYAYDRRVLDALGVKPEERIVGFVHIGRPVKPPEDRPRPPLAEIVTRFRAS
jgi:nitroreductase